HAPHPLDVGGADARELARVHEPQRAGPRLRGVDASLIAAPQVVALAEHRLPIGEIVRVLLVPIDPERVVLEYESESRHRQSPARFLRRSSKAASASARLTCRVTSKPPFSTAVLAERLADILET